MSLRDELTRIAAVNDDTLTPELVVEDARPEESPLHAHFEWDDQLAGEQFRLEQARKLIRSVVVSVRTPLGVTEQVRAYHAVADGERRSVYASLARLQSDPDEAAQVLAQAEREWKLLRAKYQALAGFLDIVRGDLAA